MGDDDTTIVVPPPEVPATPPEPTRAELWHAEHEARHAEHMAHLESIREEHRSEVNRLEQRISDLEGRIVVVESNPSEGQSLTDALDTVAVVGETIADINEAMRPEEVIEEPPSPPHSTNNGGAESTEVEPDIATAEGAPANAAPKRRGSRLW